MNKDTTLPRKCGGVESRLYMYKGRQTQHDGGRVMGTVVGGHEDSKKAARWRACGWSTRNQEPTDCYLPGVVEIE